MNKKERLEYEKILRDLTLMSDTFSAEVLHTKNVQNTCCAHCCVMNPSD